MRHPDALAAIARRLMAMQGPDGLWGGFRLRPGESRDWVGAVAFTYGLKLNELSERRASLEDAFMNMTGGSVEYQAKGGETNNNGLLGGSIPAGAVAFAGDASKQDEQGTDKQGER